MTHPKTSLESVHGAVGLSPNIVVVAVRREKQLQHISWCVHHYQANSTLLSAGAPRSQDDGGGPGMRWILLCPRIVENTMSPKGTRRGRSAAAE